VSKVRENPRTFIFNFQNFSGLCTGPPLKMGRENLGRKGERVRGNGRGGLRENKGRALGVTKPTDKPLCLNVKTQRHP
jgi:hypothetical protein